LGMSCEKMENVWRRRSFKERLLGLEDVGRQTEDDLAQQHHVMDRTWNGRTASEYQQQEGVATGVSSFTVRPTLGARMVKEEEVVLSDRLK